MLGQLVRPAGLPDLWLGDPATLGSILLYILGEAISTTQGQTPDWAPSQLHEAPEASKGGHQWYVCRCSPILALNVDLPLPGGILQGPQRLPSPDPQRRAVCPSTQWQTGFPEDIPRCEGGETYSMWGAQSQAVGGGV